MASQKTKQDQQQEGGLPDVAPAISSEVAKVTSAEMDIARGAAAKTQASNDQIMQDFVQWMVDQADTTDEDQFALMASIMAEIMSAESPAEVMKEQSTIKASDVIGQPLLLHGFVIRSGDYEESMFQHYAALTVSRPGVEKTRVLTTGATKVLMKLYALDRFGEWPQPIMFTSKPSKKGHVLDIVSF